MEGISKTSKVTLGLLGTLFIIGMLTIPYITMAIGYVATQALLIVALMFAARKTPPAFIPQMRRIPTPDGTIEMSEALAA